MAGGGPVGAAVAGHLAAIGARVVLCDAASADAAARPPAPGDRLWPSDAELLSDMSLNLTDFAQALPQTLVSWGGHGPRRIVTPEGAKPPVSIDRARLDLALGARARGLGARMYYDTKVLSLSGQAGQWRAACLSPDGPLEINTAMVIDATGRKAHLAQSLGLKFERGDALIAALRWWSGAPQSAEFIVEALPGGWLYQASLPCGSGVIGALAPRRFAKGGAAKTWAALVAQATYVSDLMSPDATLSGARFFSAAPGCLTTPLIPGFAAVGDAALHGDPICGNGIGRGLRFAKALAALLASDPADQPMRRAEYLAQHAAQYKEHLARRHAEYAEAPELGAAFMATLAGASENNTSGLKVAHL